jgi:HAE1 family hydrophobic/amphiphilic exporter-1
VELQQVTAATLGAARTGQARARAAITLAPSSITAILFQDIPKGFFPSEDIGQITARRRPTTPRSMPWSRASRWSGEIIKRDPTCVGVSTGAAATRPTRSTPAASSHAARESRTQGQRSRLSPGCAAQRPVPGINSFSADQSINIATTQTARSTSSACARAISMRLRRYAPLMEERMRRIPIILDVNSDLQVRARQTSIDIDRDVASRLACRSTRSGCCSTRLRYRAQISTIYASDDTYQVILEADPKYADFNEVLRKIMIRTPTGAMVPLETVARKTDKPTSLTVNHIAQLPSVMISFNLAPGIALGEATKAIEAVAGEVGLPAHIATSFEGSAQVFQQAVANQGMLLFAAVLVIYIILGILYESFIHPLTILSGLPSAGIGAC